VLWKAEPVEAPNEVGLRLSYVSPHGEEGYPGNLAVTMTYRLTNANELGLDYEAHTDRSTIVNLTHHGYFNLAGQGRGTILDHTFQLTAKAFNLIDPDLVPTGEVVRVQGTPFDFTRPARIGDRMKSDHAQVRLAGGFDQNWLLDPADGSLQIGAYVSEPTTGRILEMATTEPGFQLYTSNILPEGTRGKAGRLYGKWSAFCLEAQRFPQWPDQAARPSHILRPGERYTQSTVYRFRTPV
jgi:aldose 1-epimerase